MTLYLNACRLHSVTSACRPLLSQAFPPVFVGCFPFVQRSIDHLMRMVQYRCLRWLPDPVSLAAGGAAPEWLTKFAPVLLIQLNFVFLRSRRVADRSTIRTLPGPAIEPRRPDGGA